MGRKDKGGESGMESREKEGREGKGREDRKGEEIKREGEGRRVTSCHGC